MIKDGRQLAPDLSGIRADHVKRYLFAANLLRGVGARSVADMGCGCGYGSSILGNFGIDVIGIDIDESIVKYAIAHYGETNVAFYAGDISKDPFGFKNVVAFEVIEHIEGGLGFLRRLYRNGTKFLIGSVPNQLVLPFDKQRNERHFRHYTPEEICDALAAAGFRVDFLGGQRDTRSEVSGTDPEKCRTIVFSAKAMS